MKKRGTARPHREIQAMVHGGGVTDLAGGALPAIPTADSNPQHSRQAGEKDHSQGTR
ncbi:MAG: hypothetical protein QNJ97_00025 [Myxococcota bacterium]|nr:hypothetical protein [Myxococcota bacterium]